MEGVTVIEWQQSTDIVSQLTDTVSSLETDRPFG